MKVPLHLSRFQAMGETLNEPVAQYEIGSYKNFVYLILDWKTRKAAIVDPQKDLSAPLTCLSHYSFELEGIFLTHTHFDHIAGLDELVEKFPQAPVYVHRQDLHRLDETVRNLATIHEISDGERLTVGGLEIQVLHTPGHSHGECCYYLNGNPPFLFTGDTVFIRDCGRTDLVGGSNEQMFESLQRIRKLPSECILLPGHHYQDECSTLLAQELIESPPFRCKSLEELVQLP